MFCQYNQIDQQLADGLKKLNLHLDFASREKLIQFLLFLQKWNRQFNLTSVTDLESMVSYHLLDSLSIAPFITGENILDVGSGAGFPGVPLAVYFPEKQWTLLDSNGKKTRFLIQAKSEFQLNNIEIIQSRAEDWQSPKKFDSIIARALAPAKEIMEKTQALLKPQGRWLLMKGLDVQHELTDLKNRIEARPILVPGVQTKRQLIIIYNLQDI